MWVCLNGHLIEALTMAANQQAKNWRISWLGNALELLAMVAGMAWFTHASFFGIETQYGCRHLQNPGTEWFQNACSIVENSRGTRPVDAANLAQVLALPDRGDVVDSNRRAVLRAFADYLAQESADSAHRLNDSPSKTESRRLLDRYNASYVLALKLAPFASQLEGSGKAYVENVVSRGAMTPSASTIVSSSD